jgi:sugar lactone lactonase YvrE
MGNARTSRAAIVALGSMVTSGACSRPAGYVFEDLGIPQTPRAIQAREATATTLLTTVFETRGQARLVAVDLESGRQDERELGDARGADALVVDDVAGVAYVGTSMPASVWRYHLASRSLMRVEALDRLLSDEKYVWSMALGPEGTLYVGTFPGGRLMSYEPKSRLARDMGTPLPGRQYLRSLAVGVSGTVYCGLGTPAAVVAVDPRSRRPRPVDLPVSEGSSFAAVSLGKGELAVALAVGTGSRTVRVKVPDAPAHRRAAPAADAFLDPSGRYRVAVGSKSYQGRIDLTSRQEGMSIMGLTTGPDGAIYGATYYNASLFRLDPRSGELRLLGRVAGASGEFNVLAVLDSKRLLLPGYTGVLYVYDLDQPWGDDPSAANPRRIGEIGHGQHLVTAVARVGAATLAIATPPDYGRRGGAITLFDTTRLTWRTYPSPLSDQSVTALSYGPGWRLFAGTSTSVGLGATVTAQSAHLLAFDPAAERYVADHVPVGGASTITALLALDERRLLGGTDTGVLFEHDVATGRSRVVARLGHIRDLRLWEERGVVLGVAWRRGLFEVDPASLRVSFVQGSPEKLFPGIAFDSLGNAYVHDGARIYRLRPR